jgi:hypothetical protein
MYVMPSLARRCLSRAPLALGLASALSLTACGGDDAVDAPPADDAGAPRDAATPPPDAQDASDSAPPPPGPPGPLTVPPDSPPPVATPLFDPRPATPLGTTGFSVNARVQPKTQRLRWHVEYGKTTAYGATTAPEPLGPKLAAHYRESWDKNLGGFLGGYQATSVTHVAAGGASGGHARFVAPSGPDANHLDGIGPLELGPYLHNGTYVGDGIVNPYIGAGDTDVRDAKVAVDVRGTGWSPDLSEMHFWAQSDSDLAEQNQVNWRRSNWAHTAFSLTDAALLGGWQHVEYRLWNDTADWSYAGNYLDRVNYAYWTLDRALRHMNTNFITAIVWYASLNGPSGTVDFDELTLSYRNHSLLLPSNGGRLVASPPGSTDPSKLTDGWRHGPGKTWQSAPNPASAQVLVYSFVRPVRIHTVQIHQDPVYPSRRVDVLASIDGKTWSPVLERELPASSPDGPNFLQVFVPGLSVLALHVRVIVRSGYQSTAWGLGEIELFGEGAQMDTDDDWYALNADLTGLDPATTYHYRVALSDGVRVYRGADQTFVTRADAKPDVATGAATRVTATGAKVEGRLTPMGLETTCWFDYGTSAAYGMTTAPVYAGKQQSPRAVVDALGGLAPQTTYHYRAVASNGAGTTFGEDRTFQTK